ncbi:hypothetical protein AMTRI_Chr06g201260 [Amborella trichopoda]
MLQFSTFVNRFPSSSLIPSFLLVPSQPPPTHNEELLLAMEESDLEEKWSDIRKANGTVVWIGKVKVENDKEEFDADAEDNDADNVEESEGDEFEQETG